MRGGPTSSTCQVVQRYRYPFGFRAVFTGNVPLPGPPPITWHHRCSPYGCAVTSRTIGVPTPTPRRVGHWRGEPREASLGHPFAPFRASPYLNTYACPPWVTPVYPGLRWLSPTGCRRLGTLPQHARHLGLIPPSGRKNGSAPRPQALLPPASRRSESPTSGNPVRWERREEVTRSNNP